MVAARRSGTLRVLFWGFQFISTLTLHSRCVQSPKIWRQVCLIQHLDLSFAILDANSLDFSGNSHRQGTMKFLSSYECFLIALLKLLFVGNDFWLFSLSNFLRTLICKQNFWLKWIAQTLVWTWFLIFHSLSSYYYFPLTPFFPPQPYVY